MWYGKCYISHTALKFPVKQKALDEYKEELDPIEHKILMVAWGRRRTLMTSFSTHTMVIIAWFPLSVTCVFFEKN